MKPFAGGVLLTEPFEREHVIGPVRHVPGAAHIVRVKAAVFICLSWVGHQMHMHVVLLRKLHQAAGEIGLCPVVVRIPGTMQPGGHQVIHQKYAAPISTHGVLEDIQNAVLVAAGGYPVVI
ncbi:hypothetical protein SDC9_194207 [bioreactor metagenome]|uniref:Uncharacterized protein n=1 Tax=bioreactor metagenome TaxID=1076179 RepID=A0A645I6U0_9ZZZZ